MRTSSDAFTLDSDYNFVHLTNNCLQQLGENYGKHEEGNTLSYKVLQDYLRVQYPNDQISLEKHIIPRIKDLILDTIFSIKSEVFKKDGINFELLGYDFMIDEDFRVWLIEVNTNPYLGLPNDFIGTLLPKMLDDMFILALDPIYPPLNKLQQQSESGFELIYSEKESNILLNTRRAYTKDFIYPIKNYAQKQGESRLPKVTTESPKDSPHKLKLFISNLDNKHYRIASVLPQNTSQIIKDKVVKLKSKNPVQLHFQMQSLSKQLLEALQKNDNKNIIKSLKTLINELRNDGKMSSTNDFEEVIFLFIVLIDTQFNMWSGASSPNFKYTINRI